MNKAHANVALTDLQTDAERVLKEVRDSNEAVVLTQAGKATAILMSLEAYQKSEAEREILFRLARGEREISAGATQSLESVLAEAVKLLEER
jgi:prevent-host-death family protein